MRAIPPRPRGRPRDADLPARRREEILGAAARLFAERGYRETDLEAVAGLLGVGKGTLYRYFPSKEDLFLAAVDRGMRRLRERVEAESARAADPLGQIREAVGAYLAFFAEHPEIVELLIQERAEFKDRRRPTYFVHYDEGVGRWKRLVADLMRGGRLRRMPVGRVTEVMSDLLYGTMFTNLFAARKRLPAAQARDLLDVVFHGILGRRGR